MKVAASILRDMKKDFQIDPSFSYGSRMKIKNLKFYCVSNLDKVLKEAESYNTIVERNRSTILETSIK